jgi:hypothetical protein
VHIARFRFTPYAGFVLTKDDGTADIFGDFAGFWTVNREPQAPAAGSCSGESSVELVMVKCRHGGGGDGRCIVAS